jgi:nucleotide-binding universal stress UspA family protein
MTTTLLILTDFFAGANQALRFAASIAQPLGARLVLLHVERTSWPEPDVLTGRVAPPKPDPALALNTLMRELPVPAEAEIASGRVEKAVLESTKRHAPMMIVLSRPPDKNIPDELVTTTALNLLQTSPYPLLVVPPQTPLPAAPPKRIVLAADGNGFTLDKPVASIRDFFHALQAHLTVAHITESATRHTTRQALQTVEHSGLLRDLPQVHTCHICHTHAAEGILQAVAEHGAELLVMIARRHQFLDKLFHTSVTGQLILHSPVPVLVLPAQREPRGVATILPRIASKMS